MRKLLSMVAVLVAALGLVLVSQGSASALGGESVVCRFAPAPVSTPFENPCSPVQPASSYHLGFEVAGGSGTYTYSWSVAADAGVSIDLGSCGTADGCAMTVRGARSHDITVTLVLSQNGSSETLTAEAVSDPVCGNNFC